MQGSWKQWAQVGSRKTLSPFSNSVRQIEQVEFLGGDLLIFKLARGGVVEDFFSSLEKDCLHMTVGIVRFAPSPMVSFITYLNVKKMGCGVVGGGLDVKQFTTQDEISHGRRPF